MIRYRPTGQPHSYRVLLDGEDIGEVWRVRFPGSASPAGAIGGFRANHGGYRTGHNGWVADTAPEDEYPTRREAVEDMAAVRAATYQLTTNTTQENTTTMSTTVRAVLAVALLALVAAACQPRSIPAPLAPVLDPPIETPVDPDDGPTPIDTSVGFVYAENEPLTLTIDTTCDTAVVTIANVGVSTDGVQPRPDDPRSVPVNVLNGTESLWSGYLDDVATFDLNRADAGHVLVELGDPGGIGWVDAAPIWPADCP